MIIQRLSEESSADLESDLINHSPAVSKVTESLGLGSFYGCTHFMVMLLALSLYTRLAVLASLDSESGG